MLGLMGERASNQMRVFAVFLGFSLLAAGCSGVDEAMREDPVYQLGYGDGCSSAHSSDSGFASHATRNPDYAGKSATYDAGWRAGFGGCGGNEQSLSGRGDPYQH